MNHNADDFMLPSELEPAWPPSDDDIEAMELDAYDRQKLDDLIAEIGRCRSLGHYDPLTPLC